MSLETSQRIHNRVITNVGNISASNNPSQVPHDYIEQLKKGARALAAGEVLGLSEEEILAALSRQARIQKIKGKELSADELVGQFAETKSILQNENKTAEIPGVGVKKDIEVDPRGQDQSEYYEYGPEDTQYDDQMKTKIIEQMDDMAVLDKKGQKIYYYGKPLLKNGVNPNDYDDLEKQLDDLLYTKEAYTPRTNVKKDALAEKTKSRGLAAALVAQELAKVNPLRAAYNNVKNEIEADDLLRTKGNINEIKENIVKNNLERPIAVKETVPDELARAADINSEPFGVDNRTGKSFIYVDSETMEPVAGIEPTLTEKLSVNAPDTSNALNAPTNVPYEMVGEFVEKNKPEYLKRVTSFGTLPQVDITKSAKIFNERVRRKLDPRIIAQDPALANIPNRVLSIPEVQSIVDRIVVAGNKANEMQIEKDKMRGIIRKKEKPITFFDSKIENGKMKSAPNRYPGMTQVLNKLGYKPVESKALAESLFQLEMQRRSGINTEAAGSRGLDSQRSIVFDSPESMNQLEDQTEIERIRSGKSIEGRDIKTRLKELNYLDAQMPFIGATAEDGESPVIYNKTGETDPIAIEAALRQKAESFSPTAKKTYDVDQWVENAVGVTERQAELNKKLMAEKRERAKYETLGSKQNKALRRRIG